MKARIHRGAVEVGGACIELEASGQRLVLDLGLPLDADFEDLLQMPEVVGLEREDPSLLGVVITHGHPDHYGLVAGMLPSVPFFIGEAAAEILRQATFFGAASELPTPAGYLRDQQPFELGPFRITPLLVDHSAYDAYALLVEADGRRLLYSGDLRAHGRKPGTFRRLIEAPPSRVNSLVLEGTRLSRSEQDGDPDERSVELQMAELMKETPGMVLAFYSAQNLDRYVSLFRATKRAGRALVVDLYTATIAKATANASVPQASWEGVRVYVPQAQRVRVKRSGEFDRVRVLGNQRIYKEDLARDLDRFVMTFRASMVREAADLDLTDASAIWSMWPGYLGLDRMRPLHRFLDRNQIPLTTIHASGHARVSDLRRLAQAVAPDCVVPIHTTEPESYDRIYGEVALHPDGAWWEV